MYRVQCTVSKENTVHCSLYVWRVESREYSTVYNVHYTMYNVHCTMPRESAVFQAYLEEILHLKEVKCTELTQQLLQWDEQAEKEKALSDSIIVELQGQLAEQQFRNRMLQDQMDRGQSNGLQEMEPVLSR